LSTYSADSLLHNFHGVLEGLDAQTQVVEDFVLVFEASGHLVLQGLAQDQELAESLLLEALNVLVLAIQLPQRIVLELAQAQTFVGALGIDTLVQSVLRVVNSLHDVFLALDSRLDLSVKSILQLYRRNCQQCSGNLLVRRS
jgi:hypothetical protein